MFIHHDDSAAWSAISRRSPCINMGSTADSSHLQLVQACQRRLVEHDRHPVAAVATWDHTEAAAAQVWQPGQAHVVAERAALHAAVQVHHLDVCSRLFMRPCQRCFL